MNRIFQPRKIIPNHRIFHIENLQQMKFSLINDDNDGNTNEQKKNTLVGSNFDSLTIKYFRHTQKKTRKII